MMLHSKKTDEQRSFLEIQSEITDYYKEKARIEYDLDLNLSIPAENVLAEIQEFVAMCSSSFSIVLSELLKFNSMSKAEFESLEIKMHKIQKIFQKFSFWQYYR